MLGYSCGNMFFTVHDGAFNFGWGATGIIGAPALMGRPTSPNPMSAAALINQNCFTERLCALTGRFLEPQVGKLCGRSSLSCTCVVQLARMLQDAAVIALDCLGHAQVAWAMHRWPLMHAH